MSEKRKITEARVKYENGFINEVQVLIPDGESYKAYCSRRGKLSGYYSLDENLKSTSIETIIENTARFGLKISAVHYFPNYFQK